jgi:hypothetical protein
MEMTHLQTEGTENRVATMFADQELELEEDIIMVKMSTVTQST